MTQLTLPLDSLSTQRSGVRSMPLPCRNGSPSTSRRAAQKHEGRADSNRARVLAALREHPGVSTYTLSQYLDFGEETKTETRRRMDDLRRLKLAETRYNGSGVIEAERGVAWWPVEVRK